MTWVGVTRMGSRYGYRLGMGAGWLCETRVPMQYPCGNLFTYVTSRVINDNTFPTHNDTTLTMTTCLLSPSSFPTLHPPPHAMTVTTPMMMTLHTLVLALLHTR